MTNTIEVLKAALVLIGDQTHTAGPWEYVPGNEHHGPYVANGWGAGDICDCYTMSNPDSLSVRNGGDSRPIYHQHEEADANARLIAAAPDLLAALKHCLRQHGGFTIRGETERMALAAISKATGGAA